MKPILLLIAALVLAGCGGGGDPTPQETVSLPEARRGFQTRLLRQEADGTPAPEPPSELFEAVRYPSPAGKMAAYLGRPPQVGKKHPAIVWIFGGFDNGIGDTAWAPASPDNDQSARAFREAGIVTMYPSLRGGNDNPGYREGFFGEVDDVLAAADFLAKQEYVDPQRIYLGGHSTGGTLALLAAASTDRFRAVFSFGPVENVVVYGPDALVFDTWNPRELELRAPGRWLHSIRSPTFVFEGADQSANLADLESMAQSSRNPLVHCYPVAGADHFSVLVPVTRLIAQKIMADTGPTVGIQITEDEIKGSVGR